MKEELGGEFGEKYKIDYSLNGEIGYKQ